MFEVSGYLDLANGNPGMLVPVFSKESTNTPFVQSMDEFYEIEDFFPYYQYENFDFVREDKKIESDVGFGGVVAFRERNGNIWCGGAVDAVQYLHDMLVDLEQAPLLKVQLLRLANAPLAQQYEAWRVASEVYFEDSLQRNRWIDAELFAYQSNDKIWSRINSKNGSRVENVHLIADRFESVDPEQRLAVLSEPQYFEFVDWQIEWFRLKEQLPVDERIYFLANDWLYSLFSSNLEIGRTRNVLAESLRFWRTQPIRDSQFAEFLLEMIQSGQFFSDDLGLPFTSLLAALDLAKRELSEEDYAVLLLQVMANNYFSYSQTETLLARIDEVAQPRRVLASSLWPSHHSLAGGEIVVLEAWKDVALAQQDLLRSVSERIQLLDPNEPRVRAFRKKWLPLLRAPEPES